MLHHPQRVRADLTRAVGQLGATTAIVLHDMGRHREAGRFFATAVKAAEESRAQQLLVWVRARHAMTPLNYGAPKTAARLAELARAAAGGRDTAAAALASSVTARAYALSGHPEQAMAAVSEADRIASRLLAAETVDTWMGYPEQKHHVHRSQALTALADTTAARESQQAGLRLASAGGMTRPLLLLDGAMCVLRDGDPVGACEAAAEVLRAAPARFRDGLVLRRARELHGMVPDGVRRAAAGRELAELLTAA